jgi:hypothetical protein
VMLYELCVGFKPFVAADVPEMLQKQLFEAPVPPRQAASGRRISEPLERAILRALAKDRDARFATAEAFAAALDATPEGQKSARAAGGLSRRGLTYALVIAALLLVSIGVVAALHAR